MFSSGVPSWGAAKRVANRFGTKHLTLLFADTKIEHLDNYRFLEDAQKNVGGKLVKVSDGRSPWEVALEKKWIGHRPHCSFELKIKPCRKYLKDNQNKFDPATTAIYFGIDWEEYSRMDAIKEKWQKYAAVVEAPLCWDEEGWLTSNQCKEWAKDEGLKIPILYDQGFTHANCGGFCFRAGQGHFRNLLKNNRELYLHHEKQELNWQQKTGNTNTILRRYKNNNLVPLTLQEFRKQVESEPVQLVLLDEALGGCGCFTTS